MELAECHQERWDFCNLRNPQGQFAHRSIQKKFIIMYYRRAIQNECIIIYYRDAALQ